MISILGNGGSLELSIAIIQPSIYLDHWALRLFSSEPQLQNRIVSCFKKKGTLLFSWANVLEIAENAGKSAEELQRFLSEIGDRWFPIEFNPFTVTEKEEQRVSLPFAGEGFIKAYYPHIHGGPLHLSEIISLTAEKGFLNTSRTKIELLTNEMTQDIAQYRAYRKTDKTLDGLPKKPCDPQRPTQFVFGGLMDLISKEQFKFERNDVLDFLHSTVSLAYADIVLLDKHWANLGQRLKIPRVKIFKKENVEEFLITFETWKP